MAWAIKLKGKGREKVDPAGGVFPFEENSICKDRAATKECLEGRLGEMPDLAR